MTALTNAQLQNLWTSNGGNPAKAPIMAAIALAESGGRTDALNTKPPDYSVGVWQVNYYGALGPSRTAQYGSPADMVADPNRQAKAAIAISGNGSNLAPWSTFTSGAYKPFLAGGSISGLSGATQAGVAGGAPSAGALATPGATADEGYLFAFDMAGKKLPLIHTQILPDVSFGLRRSTARNVIGAFVWSGGLVIMGAGVFLLAGRKPVGPSRIVVEALQQRGLNTRQRTSQEGLLQRQQERGQEKRSRTSVGQGPGEEPF